MTKKIVTSLAILFSIMFFVSSCKKDVDKKADQDLAASVSGSYAMNYIYFNGTESPLPTDSLSGKVDVVKKDQNSVLIKAITTTLGQAPEESPLGDAQLKEENSAISLYSGTTKVGTINGSDIEIHIIENNDELVIRGKK